MAIRQAVNFPRVEVKARISSDLHRRLLEECGLCACHVNGFVAIAIAHEVARRKQARKEEADVYLESMATEVEEMFHAQVNS